MTANAVASSWWRGALLWPRATAVKNVTTADKRKKGHDVKMEKRNLKKPIHLREQPGNEQPSGWKYEAKSNKKSFHGLVGIVRMRMVDEDHYTVFSYHLHKGTAKRRASRPYLSGDAPICYFGGKS